MKFSIQERKKQVIILHKRRYTARQIAKELRMSSRDVTKILKENEREEKEAREREVIEREEKEKKRLFSSKRSEAMKLYKKGTKPIDVAIELDISAEEAKAFYHEYCSLQCPHKFLQVFTELNNTNSFNSFTTLFHLIIEKGLSIEKGIEAVEMINDISLLKEEHRDLSNSIADLKKIKGFLISDNNFLKDQNEEMQNRLNSTTEKIIINEKNLESIRKKVRETEEEIYKINSDKDYYEARKQIKFIVEEFLGNRRIVIRLAIIAVINAVKENYQNEIPIKDLPKSVYEYVSDSSDYDIYQQKLQDLVEKMWDSFSDVCTDNVLNPSLNISKGLK
jgi:FtsZ-binding cell division protein ZapB